MKEKIIDLLETRMNKCMNDQFWAVAAITAFSAFVISQKTIMLGIFTPILCQTAITLSSAYALFYMGHRHNEYYKAKNQIYDIISKEDCGLPCFISKKSHPFKQFSSWIGLTFCILLIIGSAITAFRVIAE